MAEKQKAEITNGEVGVGTLERHYRVILDFRLLAREITSEVCQESFFFNDTSASVREPYFQENIERQRRLYALLRNNRQLLEQYLLSVLAQEAGNFAYNGLMNALDARDEDELLAPLCKDMAEEDARFFEECRKEGVLDANTELIATAFRVEWIGVEVAEMSRMIVGDVKMAEVVERTKVRMIKRLNSSW